MFHYHDWKPGADPWAALAELTRKEFQARDLSLSPSWADFPTICGRGRSPAASEPATAFGDLWPLVAGRLDAGDDRSRWEAHCLAELSWFCLRGTGDLAFQVWDADKLREHLRRLKSLQLPVPEHDQEGVAFIREALYWSGKNLARWEQLLGRTGEGRGLVALQAELDGLIAARCRDWPDVTTDASSGHYSLTSPARVGITIDLHAEWKGRTMCLIGRTPAPDGSEHKGWMLDYGFPFFLIEFTDRLRTVGLDPPRQD